METILTCGLWKIRYVRGQSNPWMLERENSFVLWFETNGELYAQIKREVAMLGVLQETKLHVDELRKEAE